MYWQFCILKSGGIWQDHQASVVWWCSRSAKPHLLLIGLFLFSCWPPGSISSFHLSEKQKINWYGLITMMISPLGVYSEAAEITHYDNNCTAYITGESFQPGSHSTASLWHRCHVKMGTPQIRDPGSPFSWENGDPGPYFHNILGTPRSPFSQDPQCWTCTLTGLISLAMTSHLLQHYSLLSMQALRLRLATAFYPCELLGYGSDYRPWSECFLWP